MFYFGYYGSEITGIIFAILFWVTAAASVVGCFIKLWGHPAAIIFHLAAFVVWFFFLGFYYINIRSA